jgi:hypothetical protein
MLDWLRNRFSRTTLKSEVDSWPSIVFLLCQSHVHTPEEAVHMCEDAWGAAHRIELIGIVSEGHYAIKAGPLFFAFHSVNETYRVQGLQLTQVQQQAWDQHTAWMSIDLTRSRERILREEHSLGVAYKPLIYYASRNFSPNCLALYFPAEGVTVPNLGELIGSIRWRRMNGIDLSFLK